MPVKQFLLFEKLILTAGAFYATVIFSYKDHHHIIVKGSCLAGILFPDNGSIDCWSSNSTVLQSLLSREFQKASSKFFLSAYISSLCHKLSAVR